MTEFFDSNPALQAAFQGGIAPFVVALIVALAARTHAIRMACDRRRLCDPGSAVDRIQLHAAVRIAEDPPALARRAGRGDRAYALESRGRSIAYALAGLAGLAAVWVFLTVLEQREGAVAWATGIGIVVFAAPMVALMLSLRSDPLRAGAAGVGPRTCNRHRRADVGLGRLHDVGHLGRCGRRGADCSSTRFAAMLRAPGLLGTLTIGVMIALFAEGTLMLAKLPWYALAALLLVPLAVQLPVRETAPPVVRAAILFALRAGCSAHSNRRRLDRTRRLNSVVPFWRKCPC